MPDDVPAKDPENEVTPIVAENSAEKLIDLAAGGDLSPGNAARITSAAATRLVLIAGEAESGKTTLLATIYERFNDGSFRELLFAGSSTLVGWERRCHRARIASSAEAPDTERTHGLQQHLLHLRIATRSAPLARQDVLLTDLSGEVFTLIRDSSEECKQFGMLRRADHFVLLLDGKNLSASETRHEAFANPVALMRSCIDAGMLGRRSFVDVIFSKFDALKDGDTATKGYLKHVTDTITTRFAASLGRLRFHNVSARPEVSGIEFGFGVPELLHSWVQDSPGLSPVAVDVDRRVPYTASEFDRYLNTRLSH